MILYDMRTAETTITERGQISIPAEIRRKLSLKPGLKLLWSQVSDSECRIVVKGTKSKPVGAVAMLGYARKFRKTRRTSEWLKELRAGEQ